MQSRIVRCLLACALSAAAVPHVAVSDEGMWLPQQIPQLGPRLSALGLEIEMDRLADLGAAPLGAVISLGGCTASFVSPDGLVITNHHCAQGAIQYNSSEAKNLLLDGFLARSPADELPAGPGSRVLVTVASEDVTAQVVGDLPATLSGSERHAAIERREKALIAQCEEQPGHRCRVTSVYGGMQYQRIKQLEIRDVRLVYAPAGAIGNYGGEIDNWTWPRHTGDFSFFRAYVGPQGTPASPADANVPYRPKHWLRIASTGLREGGLVLVPGYPGSTGRYRTAREVEGEFTWGYPTRRQLNEARVATIEAATRDRPDAAIKYASQLAGLYNSIKNNQSQLAGFERNGVLARKRTLEAALTGWIQADAARRAELEPLLDGLDRLLRGKEARRERELYYGGVRRASLLGTATTLYRLAQERARPDADREPGYQERDLLRIRERLTRLDRTFDPAVDRALLRRALLDYARIATAQHVPVIDETFGIDGNTVDAARLDAVLETLYRETGLGDVTTRLAWMERDAAAFETSADPFIRLAVRLQPDLLAEEERDEDEEGQSSLLRAGYMRALTAYLTATGHAIYPDANGTLRLTYGTVKGYTPRDGVTYKPFTTVAGLLEKQTGDDPFDSPEELLSAARERRFGRYAADELDSLPVNFLSDVDSTGGNSGSPTLNARGELVGLQFDGNGESVVSDWLYEPELKRAIHVDIRYVLWVMAEVDRAHELLRDLGIEVPPGAAAPPALQRSTP